MQLDDSGSAARNTHLVTLADLQDVLPATKPRRKPDRLRFTDDDLHAAKRLAVGVREKSALSELSRASMDQWANELRLLREQLDVTTKTVNDAIKWIYTRSDYWAQVIGGAQSLRKNWPKIVADNALDIQRSRFRLPGELPYLGGDPPETQAR